MNAVEFVKRMVSALEKLRVNYMVVGSFSVNVYGVPRSTKDADFVIELGTIPITALVSELGPDFILEDQMSFETITATSRYRLKHRETNFLIELFLLSDDAHDKLRFARRRQGLIEGHQTFVPTAEDVVIQKLRWSKHGQRQKDLSDCRNVIAVQIKTLDLAYMRHWCDQHGTRDMLDQLIVEAQKIDAEE